MPKIMSHYTLEKVAVKPTSGPVGVITGIPINATGFKRARFVFAFGVPLTTANWSVGATVWEAATSGGTFTSRTAASLPAIGSTSMSDATVCVDISVDQAKPWISFSSMSMVSSACAVGAIVELYNPTNAPTTQTAIIQTFVA